MPAAHRDWIDEAVRRVEADSNRSADTHLHVLGLPAPIGEAGLELYLKDESVHPTGSLKHRLARSLFLYSLCNGWLGPDSTVVEASSGSTAVSEAYFARLIGLPFVAVMPRSTSPAKIALIEWYGGTCAFVDSAGEVYDEARRIAAERGGHYMDQFTYAERATDWRGNNNIAESIFAQLECEQHPVPAWIVVSAGTGGTSATIGRYLRYRRHSTRLLVADPEGSAFFDGWAADTSDAVGRGSRIEGIGRPRVEPSFVGGVVDDMVRVPDGASVATMRWVSERLGRTVGPSTGTNVWASLQQMDRMRAAGESGSVVTLLCDSGERYGSTYYSDDWLAEQGIDPTPWVEALASYDLTGVVPKV
ncbi:PLP-dependent cysteine synthase family protein [Nocardioides sp.]|uniref:PLP-dependent cysteine synthase family protein n=1 Tax=Nocardioides sp. TaxID=35761 RepID=UPI00261ECA56|nr:PLP-dependent cysteine synthase family protein [Nocardioides sp.]